MSSIIEDGSYLPSAAAQAVLNANHSTMKALALIGMLNPVHDEQSNTTWYSVEEITIVGRQRKKNNLYDLNLPKAAMTKAVCGRCEKHTKRPVEYGAALVCRPCHEFISMEVETIKLEKELASIS